MIAVFTKYDRLVTQVEFGNSCEFMDRTKTLDPDARNALLVKETNERFETLSVRPFRAVVGTDVPHIAVSGKFSTDFLLDLHFAIAAEKAYDGSKKSLKDLTALTAKYVKECLAIEIVEEVAVPAQNEGSRSIATYFASPVHHRNDFVGVCMRSLFVLCEGACLISSHSDWFYPSPRN